MALTLGRKLGPYEIQSPLGAGGMGGVYRARDTRLDRTVAMKILPAHLSDNPEAKQCFDREARAVSSLNHPNICILHDRRASGGNRLFRNGVCGRRDSGRSIDQGTAVADAGFEIRNRNLRRPGNSAQEGCGPSRLGAWKHHDDDVLRQAHGFWFSKPPRESRTTYCFILLQ